MAKKRKSGDGIAAICQMPDREIQSVLKEIELEDFCLALNGSDQATRTAFFRNMSQRAAEMIKADMRFIGEVAKKDVTKARKLLLGIMDRVRAANTTPATKAKPDKQKASAPPPKPKGSPGKLDTRTTPVPKLIAGLCSLATIARRDGILDLEQLTDEMDDYLALGIRMAVDGTDPKLLEEILLRKKQVILEEERRRLDVITIAVRGIQQGDNPRIIKIKCETCLP